ncbi:lipoprotein-releasing ABC transporter permease subunit [Alphaproteobacteria bacterium]|nr:lipoprotein-releasing ABC transporter permease subunit [Alphaproteobacteria bacterium]MDC1023233.1 lipoprotein-releasing ABC transporter permease subunit [Alphaproteobacteria bacterium]
MSYFIFNETERMIAFRYIKSRRVEGFISISAWFSLLGIMLGVATLIVVMSVMNGFRTELVDRILGINGHLIIYSKNERVISNYNDIINQISDTPNVVAVTPHLEGQALAQKKGSISGVIIRGVNWSDLAAKQLLWKSLDELTISNFKNNQDIIMGYRLGQKLNVKVGEFVSLISPNGMETAIGVLPVKQNFKVGGFFDMGMYEYDSNFIFIPWKKAEVFLSTNNIAHGIEVFLKNQKLTSSVNSKLKSKLNNDLIVIDWKKRNASFMSALAVEKNVMFVILTLIILVAAFNIISSMIMLVQTKKADIALMRTMGASQYLIIKIFMLTGSVIGILGTCIGVILGILVSMNIEEIRQVVTSILGQELFSAELYFLSKLPSDINFNEVSMVICISFILTLSASIFPAWKASRISPAEALRYE